ncbi:MAG TPA: hypothetical protein VGG04_14965 [Candidatus Sulfotelmatobacter sp.]|jgi:hypothetical protein
MAAENRAWWAEPWLWVEAFAIANLGFLTCDIYLAHSVNGFRRTAEYIPLFFSAIAPVILIGALLLRRRSRAAWTDLGYFVGGLSIVIGLTGVILHLDSAFFYERTIKSLTYSAPFAAPLAYTGLGFLIVMNRMVDQNSEEWAKWVLLFTLGGFVGNFVFSLTDHAVNGFFHPMEWIAVVASAVGVGFLITPLLMQVTRGFISLCAGLLLAEAAVGILGFALHAMANLHGPSTQAWKNFVYGAPPFAPLLFPNLMLLGMIGLWRLREFAGSGAE